ncbi:MAG: hypothetical protein EXS16_08605 [Gemmataceae bacterium]|nr:hypothetical protein [Gemmataceae bacterium]
MARIITKELALQIAKKLHAIVQSKKNRPHDLYSVYVDGLLVAQFGIRRGSEKDKGHDHIPSQIFLSPHEAKKLGICTMSYDDWITRMKEKERIPT